MVVFRKDTTAPQALIRCGAAAPRQAQRVQRCELAEALHSGAPWSAAHLIIVKLITPNPEIWILTCGYGSGESPKKELELEQPNGACRMQHFRPSSSLTLSKTLITKAISTRCTP